MSEAQESNLQIAGEPTNNSLISTTGNGPSETEQKGAKPRRRRSSRRKSKKARKARKSRKSRRKGRK